MAKTSPASKYDGSSAHGTDPVKNYHTIRNELKTYSAELAEKPEIVCVSKAELTDAAEVRDKLAADLGREVFLMSSVTG